MLYSMLYVIYHSTSHLVSEFHDLLFNLQGPPQAPTSLPLPSPERLPHAAPIRTLRHNNTKTSIQHIILAK